MKLTPCLPCKVGHHGNSGVCPCSDPPPIESPPGIGMGRADSCESLQLDSHSRSWLQAFVTAKTGRAVILDACDASGRAIPQAPATEAGGIQQYKCKTVTDDDPIYECSIEDCEHCDEGPPL